MGPNSISKLIPDTCEVTIKEYTKEMIVCPATPDKRKKMTKGFTETWIESHR